MSNATTTGPRHIWDVRTVITTVPDSTDAVDAVFAELESEARSSGWLCTVTIECGTLVCACE